MNFTTTLTSKYQMTLPKPVRERLGLKKGAKIDIFPTLDGGFTGKPKRESNILKFAGWLKAKDDGRPWAEIREDVDKLAGQDLGKKFEQLTGKKDAKLYRIKIK